MSLPERLAAAAASLPQLRLAVLFGSAARGSQTSVGDVDIGVRLNENSRAQRQEVETVLGRAAGRDVDIVLLDESPPQLRFEIARDGLVLLEREPHEWAEFRARAMIDWWDWAPVARRIHAAAVERLKEQIKRGPS